MREQFHCRWGEYGRHLGAMVMMAVHAKMKKPGQMRLQTAWDRGRPDHKTLKMGNKIKQDGHYLR